MIAIIVKELQLLAKDKRSYFFLLLMPALFILMFGSIFGHTSDSSVAVHIIDQDGSQAAKDFIRQMHPAFDVKTDSAGDLAGDIDKVKQGQLSGFLVIPRGFGEAVGQGKQAEIRFYRDPADQSFAPMVNAVLDGIAEQYREHRIHIALTSLGATPEQADRALAPPIAVKGMTASSDHFDYIQQVVPGMTVMFVFYIMISMAKRFFEEKKSGLLARVRSANVRPLPYLIGMWVPFLLTVIVQCLVLFAFGHAVYHLNLGNQAALALIVLALGLACTGIGLALSMLVPGENAAMAVTQVISMGGALVGGLWMPSYLLPKAVQAIGHFTPQYWAQSSLTDVIAHGARLSDVVGPSLLLAAFGLAGLTVALLRLPAFLRSAAH